MYTMHGYAVMVLIHVSFWLEWNVWSEPLFFWVTIAFSRDVSACVICDDWAGDSNDWVVKLARYQL